MPKTAALLPATLDYNHGNRSVPLSVLRTNRRKTISFEVRPDEVRILAPKLYPDRELSALLNKRLSWIQKKLEEIDGKRETILRNYVEGETFLFQGKSLVLSFDPCQSVAEARKSPDRVKVKGEKLCVLYPETDDKVGRALWVRRFLAQWYQEQAQDIMTGGTKYYESLIGVKARSISFRDYKSRWGSCSFRGDLSFNPRLIMAPNQVMDYVIVHELCHILEHNHSKAFWAHVETHFPSYKDAKKWLKDKGYQLVY